MKPNRRQFLAAGGLLTAASRRPNVLWITCEDLSPILGCYGDPYAHHAEPRPPLPRGRALHARLLRGQRLRSGPVVPDHRRAGQHSSARMHLRGIVPLPRGMNCFPAYLRQAGYYCSNNVKQDYNFTAPPDAWDESSNQAHWRKRKSGQPFFASSTSPPRTRGRSATRARNSSASRRNSNPRSGTTRPAPRCRPTTPIPRWSGSTSPNSTRRRRRWTSRRATFSSNSKPTAWPKTPSSFSFPITAPGSRAASAGCTIPAPASL